MTMQLSQDARTWGMISHLAGLAGYVIPFGNVIGPLVVWLTKKDQHPFVDDQGREALNFQITVTIALLISFVLTFILIGIFLMAAVYVAGLVYTILAGVEANKGVAYRYPFTLRFIR